MFKSPCVIQTYDLQVRSELSDPLRYTLLDNNFVKEIIFKIYLMLLFTSINNTSQHGAAPYHLKSLWKRETLEHLILL